MLKQGFVQEKVNDLSMSHYPHLLNNYPQWSRVNTLDKARYPKPFVKDKLQPQMGEKREAEDEDGLEVNELNPAQRAQYLERSLVFLKRQHQDVLRGLHEEIDALKKENKDLQFRIIMSQKQTRMARSGRRHDRRDNGGDLEKDSSSESLHSNMEEESTRSREEKLDEIKVVFLEEEIKELKHALRETRNRNTYLTQLLEQSEEQRKRQQAAVESMKVQLTQGGGATSNQPGDQSVPAAHLLQQGSRPLTLPECHAVIRHLQQQNEQQAHELDGLKSDLRDVLYSHKWTPDAYLLAKAYIAEDDMKDGDPASQSKSALPRIPLKHPTRKLPDLAYIQRDNVTLPALKQTVSNRAVERRKRTQIMQKARMRNEVLQ